MVQIFDTQRQQAFSAWLRTGRWPTVSGDVEVKFNPWHDPRNGRFTFAPGGVSSSTSIRSPGTQPARRDQSGQEGRSLDKTMLGVGGDVVSALNQIRPPSRPISAMGRGGNSRAFEDPMTLEQAFPGLQNSRGGAITVVAESVLNLFDLTGPATEFRLQFLQDQSRQLSSQIKNIDPRWHYNGIGEKTPLGRELVSVEILRTRVENLRFQRAAIIARVRGDYGPLKVETLRFVQQSTDNAYYDAVAMLKAGLLKPRLSSSEAVGNYIDREVRRNLRERYNQVDINSNTDRAVRVNKNEKNSSDGTYRRPDSRVQDVAFDVTLTRKTPGMAQVRGFFETDFAPKRVVIIRPRQLGADHTYVIARPETKR